MAKGWGRYRWLDYRGLVEHFLRPHQTATTIKLFTTRSTHEPERLKRQQRYLRALRWRGGIEVILGEFEQRDIRCRECGAWYKRPQEKKTDVNLATHLLADAYQGTIDTAFLVSADSDLVPAVEHVVQRFSTTVVLIDPPRRHSDDLAQLADVRLHISRSAFSRSQLPNPVERQKGGRTKRVYRPKEWAEE